MKMLIHENKLDKRMLLRNLNVKQIANGFRFKAITFQKIFKFEYHSVFRTLILKGCAFFLGFS